MIFVLVPNFAIDSECDRAFPRCNFHGIKCFTVVYIYFNRPIVKTCLPVVFLTTKTDVCLVSITGSLTLQIGSPGNMEVITCLAGNLYSCSFYSFLLRSLAVFYNLQTCYSLSTDLVILCSYDKCTYYYTNWC